jgi:acetaldehyde dehydrogenase
VEGAAHYLPSYAGNLDIMTSAAMAAAERIAAELLKNSPAAAATALA